MVGQEQLLGGYWFLKTLLWASMFGYLLISKVKPLVLGGGIALILIVLCSYTGVYVPFFRIGSVEFLATFFYVFGYYYSISQCKIENSKWIIPLGCVLIGFGVKYWQCTMLTLIPSKIIPYSITAIMGTLLVFSISQKLSSHKKIRSLLVYIGDNTLPILTWHFLSFKLVSLLIIIIHHLPIQRLAEFPVIEEFAVGGWFIVYFLIGIIVPLFGLFVRNYIKH